MKQSILKLQKFFKLEAERGYDDRAVVGGLARMLSPWEAEARADGIPEEIVAAVVARLRDYNRLSPASRQEALQGLWRRLQGETDVPFPPTTPPAQEASDMSPAQQQEELVEREADTHETPATPSLVEGTTEKKITTRPTTVEAQPAALNASVTVLKGVGPRHGQTLGRLGLLTLGDMLYYFPRRYDDYTKLKQINRLEYGEEVTVIGTVQSVTSRTIRNGRANLTEAIVSDGSGSLRVSWFNQPWITKRLRQGLHVVLSGKIDQYLGRAVMNSPELEQLEQQNLHTHRIVPVYPLTAKITQRWLRGLMNQVVSYWAPRVQDPLPASLRSSAGLVDLSSALLQAHFPDSWEQLKAARHRLAFDEIFLLQLGLLDQKRAWQERRGRVFVTPTDWLQDQMKRLPYDLTAAQQRAVAEICSDLASGRPMNRLLQGDVGSGKTVVAALGINMVVRHCSQAALMAPTSILAEQHYQSLLKLLAEEMQLSLERPGAGEKPASDAQSAEVPISAPLRPEQVRLMIGATPESEKQAIREGLASGEIKVVVGTHALIEDPVVFADLQLAIVDEQHRFGVDQRAALRNKGDNPHLLVMTATPIPRSLALTVYGDLDLSVMDEMPPGRQVVDTFILSPVLRERAYSLIRRELEAGHQAFIIYPLIEEAEKDGTGDPSNGGKAAVEEHARLQRDIFPDFKLGLLHGRLKPDEKEEVMARFHNREYHVLVSTSVVEVGVDVPNATVMMVEGANRFGLAQLHQFRGRVGRGQSKAYCLLIPETEDVAENERLSAMAETNDGFILAERDLNQRGPGDFLGKRQSGFADLRLANLADVRLIEKARRFAQEVFGRDPNLELPEHRILAASMARFWGEGGDIS